MAKILCYEIMHCKRRYVTRKSRLSHLVLFRKSKKQRKLRPYLLSPGANSAESRLRCGWLAERNTKALFITVAARSADREPSPLLTTC